MAEFGNRVQRALAVAVVCLLALAGVALAASDRPPRARFELVGRLDPGEAYNGDVVAHRGFAYLSSWGGGACRSLGVRVIRLADPRRPVQVARFADAASEPALAGTWTEKTIVRRVSTPAFTGDLAVTTLQRCGRNGTVGFALYDVSDPASPRRLAIVETTPRGSHEIWLQPTRSGVYVWTAIPGSERTTSADGQSPGRPDFRIYDVSDPAAPRVAGEWGAWQALGVRPDPDDRQFLDWAFVHSVRGNPSGTRAYLSYWDLGTVILDVSDPVRPRYLGRTAARVGDVDNAHSTWLAAGGRVMIETRERAGGAPVLWDIRNASRPRRLAAFALPRAVVTAGRRDHLERISGLDLNDSVHDSKVVGTTAYFSWYRQGVVAVDIKDPRKPRFLARFLPPPTADRAGTFCPGAACTSVWGVAPYGKYVLASDMVGGLLVLRLRR